MPSRYIRDGLLDSERLARAGELAEVLFVRLMLVADDYGRFDGRITVMCRKCWPIGDESTPSELDIIDRLAALDREGLIRAYEVDGKPYILIPRFRQRTRAQRSKYPDPPSPEQVKDSPLPDRCPTNDGQKPGNWKAADGPPRAGSGSGSGSYSRARAGLPKAFIDSLPENIRRGIEQARTTTQPPSQPHQGDHHGEGLETLDS